MIDHWVEEVDKKMLGNSISSRLGRATGSRRGFVMVALTVCLVSLFGVAGLAIDMGRVYVAKSEAQTFADMTVIAAAREMDGTAAGLDLARAAVNTSAMKWGFARTSFTGTTIEFSPDQTTWSTTPANPATQRFVRVTPQVSNISLFFLPITTGRTTSGVKARAAAGQINVWSFQPNSNGTLPFAPLAHDPTATTCSTNSCFGFNPGDIITLRWPSNTNSKNLNNVCQADRDPKWVANAEIGGTDERGYIQETSSQAIREAIEDDKIFYTVELGQPVTMTGGIKAVQATSLENRALQDTDIISTTYAQYLARGTGNQRRIGVVPIVNPFNNFTVIGFGKVFLYTSYNPGGVKSLCAEYIGTHYFQGGDNTGTGTGQGVFALRMIE